MQIRQFPRALQERFDAILLDAGGVLLLPDHSHVLAALRTLGIKGDPGSIDRSHYVGMAALDCSTDALATSGEPVDRDVGDQAYRLACAKALGVVGTCTQDALAELFRRSWTRIVPGSPDGLRALAGAGVPIGIVSNSDGTVESELCRLELCQVGPGKGVSVAVVVDSALVGVAKPDPRIFGFALQAMGATAGRALYIGDSVRLDVEPARAAGINALHFDPHGLCEDKHHEDIASLVDILTLDPMKAGWD